MSRLCCHSFVLFEKSNSVFVCYASDVSFWDKTNSREYRGLVAAVRQTMGFCRVKGFADGLLHLVPFSQLRHCGKKRPDDTMKFAFTTHLNEDLPAAAFTVAVSEKPHTTPISQRGMRCALDGTIVSLRTVGFGKSFWNRGGEGSSE